MKRFCLVSVMVFACTLFFAQGSNAFLEGDTAPEVIDIVYDGYCDGAHLSYDTATCVAWGYQTGCCKGGMTGVILKACPQSPFLFMGYCLGADYLGMYTIIRHDKTWSNCCCNEDGVLFIINEGTWSYGIPADADVALPSSLSP